MDLLIAPGTVDATGADTAPATGTPGWATDGNPATGVPATLCPAYAFNALQAELTGVITGAGLSLDRNDNGQVLAAIKQLMADELAKISKSQVGLIFYSPSAKPPEGFLACDGSALSRSVYSELFAVIGTLYGEGDGSTTFNLPDLRGEFVRGWDKGRGVDAGRAVGSAQAGTIFPCLYVYYYTSTSGILISKPLNSVPSLNQYDDCPQNMDSSLWNQGGNTSYMNTPLGVGGSRSLVSFTSRPRNIALLACIKY